MLSNTVLISFAGSDVHKKYQYKLHNEYGNNFHTSILYDMDWIKYYGYYDKYKEIFSYQKYAGYFLWKPLIIENALSMCPDKNILYCDSNMIFKNFNKFESYFNKYMNISNTFFIQHQNRINKDWTKYDTFHIMNSVSEKYLNANQVWSVIEGWNIHTSELLNEYKNYCTNINALTELPNIYGENYPGFVAHRWEQSILSILVEKYKIPCPTDIELLDTLDKEYNPELLKLKNEVDKDPLKKDL